MGFFKNYVTAKWLREDGPDRRMELLEDLVYVDNSNIEWTAKAGYKTDGASIPAWARRIIGDPFIGDYRDAAVIHDFYCDSESRSWWKTHFVFYEAAISLGLSKITAKAMLLAIIFHHIWNRHFW
jgi:hypothetical protein